MLLNDPKSITDNLQKAIENGDDVYVGLMAEEFQFLTKYYDEQKSLGSLKYATDP